MKVFIAWLLLGNHLLRLVLFWKIFFYLFLNNSVVVKLTFQFDTSVKIINFFIQYFSLNVLMVRTKLRPSFRKLYTSIVKRLLFTLYKLCVGSYGTPFLVSTSRLFFYLFIYYLLNLQLLNFFLEFIFSYYV